MRVSKIIQIAAAAAITAAALWLFLRDVDMAQLGARLRALSPLTIALCGALSIAAVAIRALRWSLMLPASPGTHKRGLFATVSISFMLNNILPARAGEAARVALLWKRNAYPLTVALGSLILERLLDLAVVFLFIAVPVLFAGLLPGMRTTAILLLASSGAIAFSLVLYAVRPGLVLRFARWLPHRLPRKAGEKIGKILEELIATLDWVRSPARAACVVALSAPIMACYSLMILLLADRSLGFGFAHALMASAFAAFGAALPAAPGYIGTLHAALLEGLTVLGQEREASRAAAIAYHALGYIPVTVLGLFYFLRIDFRFRDIARAREDIS